MSLKFLTLSLVVLLLQSIPGKAQNPPATSDIWKLRAIVAASGTCPKGKVVVTLRDKTKLKGCIHDPTEDQFSIVDSKSGGLTKVTYGEVTKIEKPRPPAWRGWALTGAALAVPIVIVAWALSGNGG